MLLPWDDDFALTSLPFHLHNALAYKAHLSREKPFERRKNLFFFVGNSTAKTDSFPISNASAASM